MRPRVCPSCMKGRKVVYGAIVGVLVVTLMAPLMATSATNANITPQC